VAESRSNRARPVRPGHSVTAHIVRHIHSQVAMWSACGGLSSTPAQLNAADAALCCAAGSACTYVNDHYWQCRPYSDGDTIREITGATAADGSAPGMWGQCGGMGGGCQPYGCVDGPFARCPAGSSCLRLSHWFYQCQPSQDVQQPASQEAPPSSASGGARRAWSHTALASHLIVFIEPW
jgi:hypothetical protein